VGNEGLLYQEGFVEPRERFRLHMLGVRDLIGEKIPFGLEVTRAVSFSCSMRGFVSRPYHSIVSGLTPATLMLSSV
jgi:hypothetical protein